MCSSYYKTYYCKFPSSCLWHMRMYWHVAYSLELIWLCPHLAGKGGGICCWLTQFEMSSSWQSCSSATRQVICHPAFPFPCCSSAVVGTEERDLPLLTVICSSNSEASSCLLFAMSYFWHFLSHCLYWNPLFSVLLLQESVLWMSDDDCSSSAHRAWDAMQQQVSHPTIKWCLKTELAPQPLGERGTTRKTRWCWSFWKKSGFVSRKGHKNTKPGWETWRNVHKQAPILLIYVETCFYPQLICKQEKLTQHKAKGL